MWTPSEPELYCLLGGVAIGSAFTAYLCRWAIKDHENANKLAEADYEEAVKLWRDKAEAAVQQIKDINAAIPKLLMASGFKNWTADTLANQRKQDQAKREQNASGVECYQDPITGQWSYIRYTNAPPTS